MIFSLTDINNTLWTDKILFIFTIAFNQFSEQLKDNNNLFPGYSHRVIFNNEGSFKNEIYNNKICIKLSNMLSEYLHLNKSYRLIIYVHNSDYLEILPEHSLVLECFIIEKKTINSLDNQMNYSELSIQLQ